MKFSVIAALIAGIVTYAIGQWVFQGAPITTDENSYVFQAHLLKEGRIARPAPPLEDVFAHEMIIQDDHAGWLSRYPPGHPLWLVPGVWLGDPRLMVALAAALSVLVVSRAGKVVGVPAPLTCILLLLSPFFLLMHGTLLSHTTGLLASGLMMLTYFVWRTGGRPVFAALAGLSWSWLYLNRTYSASLIAIPFGLDALVFLVRRRNRQVLVGVLLFAGLALVGVLAMCTYNAFAIGDPMTPTYLYYAPDEGLGFGMRHQSRGLAIEHTFSRGMGAMVRNTALLDGWLFGIPYTVVVLAGLIVVGWVSPWSVLLCGVTLLVVLGHVFFWYPGPHEAGPGYYLETVPYLVILAGFGLLRLWSLTAARPRLRRAGLVVALLVLAGMACGKMYREGRSLRQFCAYEGGIRRLLRSAPPRTLVILEGLNSFHEGQLVFNPQGLQSDPLVVRGLGSGNTAIARRFPDRETYLLRKGDEDALIPVDLDGPLRVTIEGAGMARLTGLNERCEPGGELIVRTARAGRDEAGWLAYGDYYWVMPGTFRVDVRLGFSGGAPERPVKVDVAADYGRKILVETNILESAPNQVLTLRFDSQAYQLIEPRVHYGGSGDVALERLEIIEEQGPPDTARFNASAAGG